MWKKWKMRLFDWMIENNNQPSIEVHWEKITILLKGQWDGGDDGWSDISSFSFFDDSSWCGFNLSFISDMRMESW